MPLLTSLTSTFPTYILPTIPFRRRRSSASTTTTASSALSTSPTTTSTPGAAVQEPYLTSHTSVLRCNRCLAQISPTSAIISKGFTGRHGRAYLVSPSSCSSTTTTTSTSSTGPGAPACQLLPNTHIGRPQQRQLVTGLHTVCDVKCALCDSVLGWKYVGAEEEAQKYKVGKFILETKRVMRDAVWDAVAESDDGTGGVSGALGAAGGGGGMRAVRKGGDDADEDDNELVEFDSQDEDECEDLFMGIWSEKLASKRRRDKAWRT